MSEIKRRRLEELEVSCHPGTKVGEYVPFYFCFRSIMLYLLYKGNHVELPYTGGQAPIVHLEADLHSVVHWANENRRRWAVSTGNAGARYTEFIHDTNHLDMLNWDAIAALDWRDPFVKEGKQAEFLLQGSFPWELIERIGVFDDTKRNEVLRIIEDAAHKPTVVVQRNWYY